ncbi:MAG: HpcH/HpaI aldolase/citrate lyase family protein [Paraglaciecola sp.]|uniref:HpcH/HpaI aldolase/citrate lyase family protein n=1 Tax=Pseudomonadati TaxID=3379134 RepID=UPI00273F6019|nr:HpcH/HpaI aldolase/citrate lyase family protein [Paraglaciecola sp.]MDP5032173.1 HpcH/HpaI aldolase/citrate lyase family protein [Paraglaciecola sp.]MDP5133069.1 HpcH/HpaI aldolase/citrate lyase family protein [Paraglaciecola sp.]
MKLPKNSFKQQIKAGQQQIGVWAALASAYSVELIANTEFDWLLIDSEHAPNDTRSVLTQLQAVAAYPIQAIVRPPIGDTALIKQYLDLGVQTLLVPMVEDAEQAKQIVAATRYPPQGIRGVGAGLARASRWNQVDDYLEQCQQEICVIVQVESVTALQNLNAIAAVEGVDGVFFGPADLSASMGLLGKQNDKQVVDAIIEGIQLVRKTGKAAGVLATDPAVAQAYLANGALFVAVGVDTTLLVNAAKHLCATFKGKSSTQTTSPSAY